MSTTKTGTVKFFNEKKGFGFITCNDSGKDFFLGSREIPEGKTVREGDQVDFDVRPTPKGNAAVNIQILN